MKKTKTISRLVKEYLCFTLRASPPLININVKAKRVSKANIWFYGLFFCQKEKPSYYTFPKQCEISTKQNGNKDKKFLFK